MYRVLIADDHDYVLEGLKFGLEADFEISTVNNGEQCMDEIRTFNPHVVMVDFKMQGLNGLEITEKIMEKRNPPAIILISACMDHDLKQEALEKGAIDCMSKPFDLGELRTKLYQAIKTSH